MIAEVALFAGVAFVVGVVVLVIEDAETVVEVVVEGALLIEVIFPSEEVELGGVVVEVAGGVMGVVLFAEVETVGVGVAAGIVVLGVIVAEGAGAIAEKVLFAEVEIVPVAFGVTVVPGSVVVVNMLDVTGDVVGVLSEAVVLGPVKDGVLAIGFANVFVGTGNVVDPDKLAVEDVELPNELPEFPNLLLLDPNELLEPPSLLLFDPNGLLDTPDPLVLVIEEDDDLFE